MEVDSWQRVQTKVFIDLWKKHPILYDSSHPHSSSKFLRNESIRMIMKELVHYKPNITLNGVKKKIRTLQSQFCKEKSKLSISNGDYIPSLWCFEDLSFLLSRPFKVDEEPISEEEYNEFLDEIKIVDEPPFKKEKPDHYANIDYQESYEDEGPSYSNDSRIDDTSLQEEIDLEDSISYIDGINDYEFTEASVQQHQKKHSILEKRKAIAEINYLQKKAAYFSEMIENVRIERRLMNLKSQKLALEIKQMRN